MKSLHLISRLCDHYRFCSKVLILLLALLCPPHRLCIVHWCTESCKSNRATVSPCALTVIGWHFPAHTSWSGRHQTRYINLFFSHLWICFPRKLGGNNDGTFCLSDKYHPAHLPQGRSPKLERAGALLRSILDVPGIHTCPYLGVGHTALFASHACLPRAAALSSCYRDTDGKNSAVAIAHLPENETAFEQNSLLHPAPLYRVMSCRWHCIVAGQRRKDTHQMYTRKVRHVRPPLS